MKLIQQKIWDRYKTILGRDVQDTFYQANVLWMRSVRTIQQFGNTETYQYTEQPILALMEYNVKRTWPLNMGTVSGEIDKESMSMLIKIAHLTDLQSQGVDSLTPDGFMKLDPVKDRFIHRGIVYKSTAETDIVQAQADDLTILLVLQRQLLENASDFKRY